MEIRSQTGLRGFAALIVVSEHLYPLQDVCSNLYLKFKWLLCAGASVDLFFMLSGFILAYVYSKNNESNHSISWKKYHIARFARIYPLHLLTTLTRGLVDQENYQLSHILPQLFLVHVLPYLGFEERPWNFPSWSICIEYICYIFIFPSCVYLQKKNLFKSLRVALVIILGIMIINIVYLLYYLPDGTRTTFGWPAVSRGVSTFSTGFIIYCISYNHKSIARWAVKHSTYLFLFSLLIHLYSVYTDSTKWILVSTFPLLLLSFSSDGNSLVHRFFKSKPIHYLGLISYSLYLWHGMVVKILFTLFRNFDHLDLNNTGLGYALFFFVYIVIIGVSALSYHYFELPAKKFILSKFANKNRALV